MVIKWWSNYGGVIGCIDAGLSKIFKDLCMEGAVACERELLEDSSGCDAVF